MAQEIEDAGSSRTSDSKCSEPEIHLLGEIVVLFGSLEHLLEVSIWKLLAPEDDKERYIMAQIITAEMSNFQQKTAVFASMFRQRRIASAEPELKALELLLRAAGEHRNQLMHSSWSYTSLWGGRDLMRTKAGRASKENQAGKRRLVKMTAEDIKAVRDRIKEATESLIFFTIKYIQEEIEIDGKKVRFVEYEEQLRSRKE
jgi:hypothetical protein